MTAAATPQARSLAPRRHAEILRRIAADGSVGVSELADFFDVSRETIRRDLKLLADRGRVDIVHGGAEGRQASEPALDRRASENAEGKSAIAHTAAGLVEDGMVVLLDSGTTTLALAHALVDKRGLTICTGSLAIALLLCRAPEARIHMLGGEIDPREEATTGIDAIEAISRFRVDVAFIGGGGLSPDGEITDYSRAGAEQRAHMIAAASRAFFLVDQTKFGRLTPIRIPHFQTASGVIVDAPPPLSIIEHLARKGLRLIVAGET
ncbi:DeoR/GlpR family DNA-binding transcription regulator [Phreatobacter stygius]|uniref:DeoR/GlpR transcriptional regulator n=1 Tax=Phreatobacter stygius TaxID=1940610 RepID=A0A4D7B2M7_9HYPH|nr:DeoR/GlpR family DNA-binding transcription regulator [Phreatobacter stygius]QCI63786.1 DeoR/GlpR transcriptional regulator [Phreatobacter stygius]